MRTARFAWNAGRASSASWDLGVRRSEAKQGRSRTDIGEPPFGCPITQDSGERAPYLTRPLLRAGGLRVWGAFRPVRAVLAFDPAEHRSANRPPRVVCPGVCR